MRLRNPNENYFRLGLGLILLMFAMLCVNPAHAYNGDSERDSFSPNVVDFAAKNFTYTHFELSGQFCLSHSLEVIWATGAPATTTITIKGVMRGGTVQTLLTSTVTTNQVLFFYGIYDHYTINVVWTGASPTNVTLNLLGSVQPNSPQISGTTLAGLSQPFTVDATGGMTLGASGVTQGDGASNTAIIPVRGNGSALTFPTMGAVFNGTTWDRMRGDTSGVTISNVNSTLADATSNATKSYGTAGGAAIQFQSMPFMFNGSTWDRERTIGASQTNGAAPVGVQAVGSAFISYTPTQLGANAITLPASSNTALTNIIDTRGVKGLTLFSQCGQIYHIWMNSYKEDGTTIGAANSQIVASVGTASTLETTLDFSQQNVVTNGVAGTAGNNNRVPKRAVSFQFVNTTATPSTCTASLLLTY